MPIEMIALCPKFSTASDFKTLNRYRLTGQGSFTEVGIGGELKGISVQEESTDLALHTEGAFISLPRTVIINDDLNVAAECLKAAIIAKKLQTKTALEAITAMAERLKEERDGRFARGH